MLLLLTFLALASDTISLPWAPVERVEPGAVIVHRQPAVSVITLRLSIRAQDPAGYAGVGHLIQHLQEPMLRERMNRVGGTLSIQRTPDALVYSVSGPAVELEYMAETLKLALRLPEAGVGSYMRAVRDLRDERLAEWETAPSHVRAVLRSRLFPEDLPAAGTSASVARLTVEVLPAAWASLYRPDRVALVTAGDVTTGSIRSVFADLPPFRPADLPIHADTVVIPTPEVAETTRGWYAMGYAAPGADPAELSVVARVLQDRLEQRLPGVQVAVEHWWTHHGQALALVAAAHARLLPDTERALEAALGTMMSQITDDDTVEAARLIRREMLFYARSPERTAELLGAYADRDASYGVQDFYDALQAVRSEDVIALIDELRRQTPARIALPPQRPASE